MGFKLLRIIHDLPLLYLVFLADGIYETEG